MYMNYEFESITEAVKNSMARKSMMKPKPRVSETNRPRFNGTVKYTIDEDNWMVEVSIERIENKVRSRSGRLRLSLCKSI